MPTEVYLLLGSTMFGLFTGFYGAASGTLQAGGALMMQVKFPHEALLFKQLAIFLANFLLYQWHGKNRRQILRTNRLTGPRVKRGLHGGGHIRHDIVPLAWQFRFG